MLLGKVELHLRQSSYSVPHEPVFLDFLCMEFVGSRLKSDMDNLPSRIILEIHDKRVAKSVQFVVREHSVRFVTSSPSMSLVHVPSFQRWGPVLTYLPLQRWLERIVEPGKTYYARVKGVKSCA